MEHYYCEYCEEYLDQGKTRCGECGADLHEEPARAASSGSPSAAANGSAIYRDMWAVVFPDGHIVTGSDLQTEEDAWRIALGWPGSDEIEAAKRRGALAVKVRLRYHLPNAGLSDSPGPKTNL